MGYQTKIRLTIITLLLATCGYAQQVVHIKGIVVDSLTNKPLHYVNVMSKNANRGTLSDASGNFSFNAHPNDTIQFSLLGYRLLELPAKDWEPSIVLLTEIATILKTVTIEGEAISPYEGLFDEQEAERKTLHEGLPFYYSREKKQKIMLARQRNEKLRVKGYVDLIVKDDKVKNELIKRHRLTENEYYDLLGRFNQKNYAVMYYLSDSELLSLLYRFYDANSPR